MPSAFVLILSGHTGNPESNGRYEFDGYENGKPKWSRPGGNPRLFWTGGSWDCFFGGYSPEAPIDSPAPPLTGYTRDQGSCDIRVQYERKGSSGPYSLEEIAAEPSGYALILQGHAGNSESNGRYEFDGYENGKPKWSRPGGNPKLFWTGGSWDCFFGGYSPEAPIDSPVPPLTGYTKDQGKCDIRVTYERTTASGSSKTVSGSSSILDEVAKEPASYSLILQGHTGNSESNGRYEFDGYENGKPKWSRPGGNPRLFWTGGSWDCFFGGYSPEAPIDSPVPPLNGYTRDQGSCNIQVRYERTTQYGSSSILDEVAKEPTGYALILQGHTGNPESNGRYKFDGYENGKPKWSRPGGNPRLFWTGGSWDCFFGGYSPEAPIDSPVPPLTGYTRDQGSCDIRVTYERTTESGSSSILYKVAGEPAAYALILHGHTGNPESNGRYEFDGYENGKPKWSRPGGNPRLFWTGGSWDCFFGGYSPEAPIDSPVPPLNGYTRDQGSCDIQVTYERTTESSSSSILDQVAREPINYILVLVGHTTNPDSNGNYEFDGYENGKQKWSRPGGMPKLCWTGESWDCQFGGYSPEAEVDTPVPPLTGYTVDQGTCDIRIRYVRKDN